MSAKPETQEREELIRKLNREASIQSKGSIMKLTDEQIEKATRDAKAEGRGVLIPSILAEHLCKAIDGGITGDGRGEAAPHAQDGKVWAIDHSAGRPILVLNGCSVIEAEDAEYVLSLVRNADATPPQQEQAAPVQDGLLKRAVDLHEKAGMPWAEAEKLALSEAGVEDRHIDELAGNTDHATICSLLSEEEVREFTRTILIYGQPLLSAAPKAQEPEA